jgi:5-methylcytosine-specific restriction enzyme subunit McrC
VKIPIQNLYYLLCFAWNRIPQEMAFDVAAIPASSDVLDLCAHLLTTGTDLLLRRGLDQGYLLREEQTARLRGRINITQTAKRNIHSTPQAVCEFDELSPNVLHNQILRASVGTLIHAEHVSSDLKEKLRMTYSKLSGIDSIQVSAGMFGRVQIHRNNRYYAFLLFVSRLVHSLKLPDHGAGGRYKFNDLLSDEKVMEKVFEEFLRNFYRLKQREFSSVGSNHLKWNAEATDAEDLDLLPVMKTDITLRSSHRVIIMDAKYYKNALQEHHGTAKAHSGNLYQLTAYLRAEGDMQTSIRPEGILIYPVGDNSVDASFVIDGYPVRLFTLNLSQDWRNIECDLLQLISKLAN